jgi:1,4-alpha-glucan branching enzyme
LRASKLAELKNQSFDEALETVKNQKVQLVSEKLLKMLLTGELDKYPRAESSQYWFEPQNPQFVEEVLNPLGIKVESGIRPEKLSEISQNAYSMSKLAMAFTYSIPGPVMVFQGDEKADITPFRFFREFESIKEDKDNLFIEKGYHSGKEGLMESKLGNINYSDYAKNKTQCYQRLISDLNKLASSNPAMTNGYYIQSDTIKHTQSKVIATHIVSDESENELFTISNFENASYPRNDADSYYIKFPKGSWMEVINTDDKKYGGSGYANSNIINSDGENNVPINLAKYSTAIFKKVG